VQHLRGVELAFRPEAGDSVIGTGGKKIKKRKTDREINLITLRVIFRVARSNAQRNDAG